MGALDVILRGLKKDDEVVAGERNKLALFLFIVLKDHAS